MSVCRRQGSLYSWTHTFKHVFIQCLLCVGVFPRNVPKQTKHRSCCHYLSAMLLKFQQCSLVLLLREFTTHSKKGPFYLIPAPPKVVRCAVFIDLCGRSAFLNPAASQEAFTYHHVSFVCIFHFFQSLSLGIEQGKAIAPAFHLSPTGLNKIRVSSFMFSAQSVISTRGLN